MLSLCYFNVNTNSPISYFLFILYTLNKNANVFCAYFTNHFLSIMPEYMSFYCSTVFLSIQSAYFLSKHKLYLIMNMIFDKILLVYFPHPFGLFLVVHIKRTGSKQFHHKYNISSTGRETRPLQSPSPSPSPRPRHNKKRGDQWSPLHIYVYANSSANSFFSIGKLRPINPPTMAGKTQPHWNWANGNASTNTGTGYP